jgi:NAD(P)-dependent dehydrogenase (short-subunit alcohol dehydrogenase family)
MIQVLKGKVIILTGGSGFLGEEMGCHLLKLGAFVINIGRKKPRFCKNFRFSRHYKVDFYDSQLLEKTLSNIFDKYKVVDILINNSFDFSSKTGFNSDKGRLNVIEKETFMSGINSGIYWTFQCSQFVGAKMLKKKKGIIINIASLYSFLVPDARMYEGTEIFNPVIYGVSKHGIIGLTKYLASFWGRHGIRVNALSPGTFPNTSTVSKEESPNKVQDDLFFEMLENKCALKRVGVPEDLSSGIEFLCSENSRLLNGENIVIDGGWSLL